MMNIAIVVKEFPPDVIGGTEIQTKKMARELDKASHEVTVYTKAYRHNRSDESLSTDIVRVPNLRVTPFLSTLTFVLAVTILLIRDADEYDLLQCMMIYPNGFVGQVVNRITGLPYFAWIRGGDYYFMKNTAWKRWMIKRVLKDTLVLVQTEQIGDDVRKEFPEASLRVLGNGVDLPDRRANGDRIVFVGRLENQKGVDVLLRALANLDEHLIVVGDGPERQRLEALADDLGVSAEFVGRVAPDTVGEYFRRGKLFVLPSVTGEGLPNALIEAYSHELPAVATDTGGVADAVVDGETGFLIQPDSVSELADRIETLSHDDRLREEMGRTARAYVEERYSWSAIVMELEEVYDECIN